MTIEPNENGELVVQNPTVSNKIKKKENKMSDDSTFFTFKLQCKDCTHWVCGKKPCDLSGSDAHLPTDVVCLDFEPKPGLWYEEYLGEEVVFGYKHGVFKAKLDEKHIIKAEIEWDGEKKVASWKYQLLEGTQPVTTIVKSKDGLKVDNQHRDRELNKKIMQIGCPEGALEKVKSDFLKIPESLIEKDVAYWSVTRDRIPRKEYENFVHGGRKKEEYSEEAKKLAEQRMKDGTALYYIGKTFQTIHVGENETILSAFLDALSSLSPTPQMLKVGGESSSGKSHLVNTMLSSFPKKYVKKIGYMSPAVLNHTNWEGNPEIKILYIQEAGGAGRDGIESLKLMSNDDGGFVAEWVEGSPSTGFKVVTQKIPVKTIITTSTKIVIDTELENRMHVVNIDETKEQTKKILDRRASVWSGEHKEESVEWIRALIEMLEEYDSIIIPFAPTIRKIVSDRTVKARRDIDKMYVQIAMSAFLNQKNRPSIIEEGKKILYAMPEDAYNAFVLSLPSFEETISGMTKIKEAVLRVIRDNLFVKDTKEGKGKYEVGEPMTYREVAQALFKKEHIKKSKKQIQRICEDLEDDNYVEIIRNGTHKVAFVDEYVKMYEKFEDYKNEICSKVEEIFKKKFPITSFIIPNIVIHPITGARIRIFEHDCRGDTSGTSETSPSLNEGLGVDGAILENSIVTGKKNGGEINEKNDNETLAIGTARREGIPGNVAVANHYLPPSMQPQIECPTPIKTKDEPELITEPVELQHQKDFCNIDRDVPMSQRSHSNEDFAVIRLLEDIPPFVESTASEMVYPKKNDFISLDKTQANILINRGSAVRVDMGGDVKPNNIDFTGIENHPDYSTYSRDTLSCRYCVWTGSWNAKRCWEKDTCRYWVETHLIIIGKLLPREVVFGVWQPWNDKCPEGKRDYWVRYGVDGKKEKRSTAELETVLKKIRKWR